MQEKKEMNIIIKNTGSTRLNLYSIFPGNIDEHLITNSTDSYIDKKGDYERVPLFIANELEGQYLGQWIYFRQNNPFSKAAIYYDTILQNAYDFKKEITVAKLVGKTENGELVYVPGTKILNFNKTFIDYIGTNNNQVLLGFRNNRYISGFDYNSINEQSDIDKLVEDGSVPNIDKVLEKFNTYIYKDYNVLSSSNSKEDDYLNQYILRYEDIIITDGTNSRYLDDQTSLTEVMSKVKYSSKGAGDSNVNNTIPVSNTNQFVGGFLYPNLLSKAQIITSGGEQASKTIDMGSSLSIPIVFEYYVESGKSTITKSLYFDLRNSLISDPLHYMIEVTGNYDYTTTGEIYTDIDDIIS